MEPSAEKMYLKEAWSLKVSNQTGYISHQTLKHQIRFVLLLHLPFLAQIDSVQPLRKRSCLSKSLQSQID